MTCSSARDTVVADFREQRSATFKAFEAHPNVNLIVEHLPVGDYVINNQIIFERKTLDDFCASIQDGRLFMQAERLLLSCVPGAIVLENSTHGFLHSGMRREAIQGALITCSLIYGLPILRSCSAQESVQVMLYAAHQVSCTIRRPFLRKGRRPKGRRKWQLYVLQGLPGIGPFRAEQLLNSFKSVQRVMTATCEELAGVKGIGPVLAAKICNVVKE